MGSAGADRCVEPHTGAEPKGPKLDIYKSSEQTAHVAIWDQAVVSDSEVADLPSSVIFAVMVMKVTAGAAQAVHAASRHPLHCPLSSFGISCDVGLVCGFARFLTHFGHEQIVEAYRRSASTLTIASTADR
jgi:hypothetical protein